MTLQREALQMCLEYIETDAHERRHVRWKINEALAEQQEPVAWMHEWEDGEKIPMLKGSDDRKNDKPKTVRPLVYGDMSPQPAQQEPVAGLLVGQDSDGRYVSIAAKAYADTLPLGEYKLYTPPPAQRKPLTVHEIAEFVGTHEYGAEQLKWFRLGEAAHGIKENT